MREPFPSPPSQAAGGLARGATFSYTTGPDGRRYAVGGEVGIDMSTSNDPRTTISKMQREAQAATAPQSAEPRGIAAWQSANDDTPSFPSTLQVA